MKDASAISDERDRVISNARKVLPNPTLMLLQDYDCQCLVDTQSDTFVRIMNIGGYESVHANVFRLLTRPDYDVVDVGANVGFYSVFAAGMLSNDRRVLAMEPSDEAWHLLLRNIALNGCEGRVLPVNAAASNEEGEVAMSYIPGKSEYSTIVNMVHPSVNGDQVVSLIRPAYTIDDLVSQHNLTPGIVKVDVEGAEGKVIAGMTQTLRKFKPRVMMELSDYLLVRNDSSSQSVVDAMKAHGYTPYHVDRKVVCSEYGNFMDAVFIHVEDTETPSW